MKSKNLKITLIILITTVGTVGFYALFLYSPYSNERVTDNWSRAKLCDNEAIMYLADFYEKQGSNDSYTEVLKLGASCKNQWAIDYLHSLKTEKKGHVGQH